MSVANDIQLGSIERIHEKMEKIKQYAREAKQQLADDGAEAQGLSDVVQRELLQQVEELQQEVQCSRERAEVREHDELLVYTSPTSRSLCSIAARSKGGSRGSDDHPPPRLLLQTCNLYLVCFIYWKLTLTLAFPAHCLWEIRN